MLAALNLSLSAFAESDSSSTPWYDVQMVIFLNHNIPSKEAWPERQTAAVIPADAITLQTPSQIEQDSASLQDSNDEMNASSTQGVDASTQQPSIVASSNPLSPNVTDNLMVLLPPSSNFSGVITKLQKSGLYPVIYSAHWRMPLNTDQSVTIATQGDINEEGQPLLSGSVTFTKKRFFYVQPNLTYAKSLNRTSDRSISASLAYFPMMTDQKITLNNLTYIDNPVLGLLVQLTPYQRAAESSDDTGTAKPLPTTP